MPVRAATYTGPEGGYTLLVPELAYRRIVSVKREGLGFNLVSDAPVDRQVQYDLGSGGFTFVNPFTVSGPDYLLMYEKIHIIWYE